MSRQFFPVTKLRRRDSVWTNGDTIKTNMPSTMHADCVKWRVWLDCFFQIFKEPGKKSCPFQYCTAFLFIYTFNFKAARHLSDRAYENKTGRVATRLGSVAHA